jgi:hypothetical protein
VFTRLAKITLPDTPVVTNFAELIGLQYRPAGKGMLAGYLLATHDLPCKLRAGGRTLAGSMATVSGSDTPVQRLAAALPCCH